MFRVPPIFSKYERITILSIWMWFGWTLVYWLSLTCKREKVVYFTVMTKVPLSFHLGNKPPSPNLPKKNRLILLFVIVNLSRFSLWLIVGSIPISVVFVLLPLSKLSLSQNFFYLQFMVSVVFKLHDTEEVPLKLQWLWSRNDVTPRYDLTAVLSPI